MDDSPKTKTVCLGRTPLLDFFMGRLFPACIAKLLGFHALGMFLFIFRGGVITIFTITTLQSNNVAHYMSLSRESFRGMPGKLFDNVGDCTGAYGVAAFANREA